MAVTVITWERGPKQTELLSNFMYSQQTHMRHHYHYRNNFVVSQKPQAVGQPHTPLRPTLQLRPRLHPQEGLWTLAFKPQWLCWISCSLILMDCNFVSICHVQDSWETQLSAMERWDWEGGLYTDRGMYKCQNFYHFCHC
jgi:hypothetical protein